MNRFFSKLDLRDIKISPEGSRFPPDADELEENVEAERVAHEEPQALAVTEEIFEEMIVESGSTAASESDTNDYGIAAVSTWVESASSYDGQASVIESETFADHHVAVSDEQPAAAVVGAFAASGGEVLKVSARSRPSAVAGAIAGVVRESGRAEVQAIGAGATNQAVKAVAIARDYLRETGIDAICLPAFIDVTIENEDRTAIRLVVEAR